MSTEVTKGAQTALTIRDDQTTFTPEQQQALLHHAGVSQRAQPADVEVFFHQVKRTGLDPFAKQIYMIERQGKQTIQTGIDGFRLIARRAIDRRGESLGYEETLYATPDGSWHELLPQGAVPVAAKVVVLRNGQRFPGTAMYDEYVGRKRDGSVNQMWATKPGAMLAKCAEALALRKAFPQDLSGLYTSDEMQQADNHAQPAQQPAVATQPPPEPQQDVDPLADRIDKVVESQNVGEVAAFGKFLANSHPDHPRLDEVRGHYNDLLAQRGPEFDNNAAERAVQEQTARENQSAREAVQDVLDAEIVEEPQNA